MNRVLTATVVLALAAGCGTAREVGGGEPGCTTCHGFPPATAHPVSAGAAWTSVDCAACHAATLDAAGAVLSGGAHQNGATDVVLPWHLASFGNPVDHGPAAMARFLLCEACHGTDFAGRPGYPAYAGGAAAPSCSDCHPANWRTDCTFCHGSPPATGQHDLHVVGQSFGCGVCHAGYTATVANAASHLNGVKDVTLTTGTWSASGKTCSNVTCHGSTPNSETW